MSMFSRTVGKVACRQAATGMVVLAGGVTRYGLATGVSGHAYKPSIPKVEFPSQGLLSNIGNIKTFEEDKDNDWGQFALIDSIEHDLFGYDQLYRTTTRKRRVLNDECAAAVDHRHCDKKSKFDESAKVYNKHRIHSGDHSPHSVVSFEFPSSSHGAYQQMEDVNVITPESNYRNLQ
mmetsp:Transcript_20757/g.26856  ORF Transcript_20757/g.26856 Transcript_20757/m.26856 type:complete len:177 (+) Transcript_20757:100-630(+)